MQIKSRWHKIHLPEEEKAEMQAKISRFALELTSLGIDPDSL